MDNSNESTAIWLSRKASFVGNLQTLQQQNAATDQYVQYIERCRTILKSQRYPEDVTAQVMTYMYTEYLEIQTRSRGSTNTCGHKETLTLYGDSGAEGGSWSINGSVPQTPESHHYAGQIKNVSEWSELTVTICIQCRVATNFPTPTVEQWVQLLEPN